MKRTRKRSWLPASVSFCPHIPISVHNRRSSRFPSVVSPHITPLPNMPPRIREVLRKENGKAYVFCVSRTTLKSSISLFQSTTTKDPTTPIMSSEIRSILPLEDDRDNVLPGRELFEHAKRSKHEASACLQSATLDCPDHRTYF